MPRIIDAGRVDGIDVVAIADAPDWTKWTTLPGEVAGTWTGTAVREALDLVAALPAAEQMRCFTPKFGIRLRAGAAVLGEVAFCFSCHNALGLPSAATPELPPWFTFDPDSEPAQRLLSLFRSVVS